MISFNEFDNNDKKHYIEYWYEDDDFFLITPIIIKEKINSRKYLISHNCEESFIKNAPDEIINKNDIL